MSLSTESLESAPAVQLLEGLARIHQAVLVADGDGRIRWMSPACREQDFAGRFRECLEDPRRAPSLRRRLLRLLGRGRQPLELSVPEGPPLRGEVTVLRVPGEDAPDPEGLLVALLHSSASGDADGGARADLGADLGSVLECLPEALIAVDRRGSVLFANPAFEELSGLRAGEVTGCPVASLLSHPADLMRLARLLARADGTAREEIEVRLPGDGGPRRLQVSARPLRGDGGRAVGAVATLRDVTEERRAQDALARKTSELEHYVHAISHDLRSPLVSLLGFSKLLEQDYGDRLGEKGLHFLSRIEQGARTMEALVNDLLELSRIGRTGARARPVDVLDVLRQLHAEVKPRLDRCATRILLPENPPPPVRCDRMRLYQLFSNLIGNALDHMGDVSEPQIEVTGEVEEGMLRICVRDNGRGIPPEQQERIFELFQSLGPRTDGRRGTGLGLAIVRKIAETHGGRAWVESRPGAGAAFHVTLPLA